MNTSASRRRYIDTLRDWPTDDTIYRGSLELIAAMMFGKQVTFSADAGEGGYTPREIAMMALGLDADQTESFLLDRKGSEELEERLGSRRVSYADAARVLDHFVDTGEVNWEIAAPKEYGSVEDRVSRYFDALCSIPHGGPGAAQWVQWRYVETNRTVSGATLDGIEDARVRGQRIYDVQLQDNYAALLMDGNGRTIEWVAFPLPMTESAARISLVKLEEDMSDRTRAAASATLDGLMKAGAEVVYIFNRRFSKTSFLVRGTDKYGRLALRWEDARRQPKSSAEAAG